MNRLASSCVIVLLLAGSVSAETPPDAGVERVISPSTKVADGRPSTIGKSAASTSNGLGSTALALIVVLALLGGVAWVAKRQGWTGLPAGAGPIQVLARAALDHRHTLLVTRCGARLLILAVSPAGLTLLCEITDPAECQSLSELCESTGTGPLSDRLTQLWTRRAPAREAA